MNIVFSSRQQQIIDNNRKNQINSIEIQRDPAKICKWNSKSLIYDKLSICFYDNFLFGKYNGIDIGVLKFEKSNDTSNFRIIKVNDLMKIFKKKKIIIVDITNNSCIDNGWFVKVYDKNYKFIKELTDFNKMDILSG